VLAELGGKVRRNFLQFQLMFNVLELWVFLLEEEIIL